jgi:hypothetical protein
MRPVKSYSPAEYDALLQELNEFGSNNGSGLRQEILSYLNSFPYDIQLSRLDYSHDKLPLSSAAFSKKNAALVGILVNFSALFVVFCLVLLASQVEDFLPDGLASVLSGLAYFVGFGLGILFIPRLVPLVCPRCGKKRLTFSAFSFIYQVWKCRWCRFSIQPRDIK